MKKNISVSLTALALLLNGLFVNACSSNTQEGIHSRYANRTYRRNPGVNINNRISR